MEMSARFWGAALLQRILLLATAGLVAVFLLHVPAGIVETGDPAQPSAYDAARWLQAGGRYLAQLVRGDLGLLEPLGVPGYRETQPVAAVLQRQLPLSGLLLAVALALALALGTCLGFLSSRFSGRILRGTVLTGVLLLLSCPDILLVLLLRRAVLWALAHFGVQLLSGGSFGPFELKDVIAPALALSALPASVVARVACVAFDEIHGALYVRTARAKGVHPGRIVLGHVLKNAWIQVADAGPVIVGSLVTGLVVVEYSFYYPGVGRTLGLMLEMGGQPAAASSFALALLVGAMVTDGLFWTIRLALDPRLKEQVADRTRIGGQIVPSGLKALSPGGLFRGLREWLRDLPYALAQAAWALRPTHLLGSVGRNPPLLAGLIGVLGLVGLAVFGGNLADLRQTGVAPKYIVDNGEVFFPPFRPGLTGYPLGSDIAGRDLLSRLLVGARYTIFFTLAVTPVRFLVALPWGLLAGLYGRFWTAASRTLSLMFSALPVMLIPAALLPVQAVFSPQNEAATFWLITGILAIVGIPRLVEAIRQQVESTLVQPFVEGAQAAGATGGRILLKHVLPHLGPQLWVAAAADMGWTLLLLAQLGVFSIFLGGAVPVDIAYGVTDGPLISRLPDWSSMLSKPYVVIYRAPWALWVPAVAFLLAIISFNLTAEGLRRRAQQLAAGAALPEPEVLPDGTERMPVRARRRLVLEWAAALLVAALTLGAGLKYGKAEAPPSIQDLSPMALARQEVQQVLETVYGSGAQFEKAKAITRLPDAMRHYLSLALDQKLTAAQIQEDTQGRVNLFPLDEALVVQFQVPPGVLSANAFASHIWIWDPEHRRIDHVNSDFKPASVAARQGILVMAGTVPVSSHWELHFFRRHAGAWLPDQGLAERVHGQIPPEYTARLVEGRNRVLGEIEMEGGPLNSARVDPTGDVTVCQNAGGPCVTVPFSQYAD